PFAQDLEQSNQNPIGLHPGIHRDGGQKGAVTITTRRFLKTTLRASSGTPWLSKSKDTSRPFHGLVFRPHKNVVDCELLPYHQAVFCRHWSECSCFVSSF